LIETERLLLRKPRPEDADDLVETLDDPEVARWVGGPAGGREGTLARIEAWLARWEANGIGHFVLEREGRAIGRCGFVVWDGRTWEGSSYADAGEAAETELGWAVARASWGRGYATEAARALLAWVDTPRVISLVDPENVRSARVAAKLGARVEGQVSVHGRPADVWSYPR
jgi:RimJ/RimL family protein N-acetyltransferase